MVVLERYYIFPTEEISTVQHWGEGNVLNIWVSSLEGFGSFLDRAVARVLIGVCIFIYLCYA